ncbi:MAG: hypothetical protein ACE5IC_06805 [Candidatus Brocadiales bacterium]
MPTQIYVHLVVLKETLKERIMGEETVPPSWKIRVLAHYLCLALGIIFGVGLILEWIYNVYIGVLPTSYITFSLTIWYLAAMILILSHLIGCLITWTDPVEVRIPKLFEYRTQKEYVSGA